MVKIVDNRTALSGRLTGIEPDAELADHQVLRFKVSDVSAYQGYPQLVHQQPGDTVGIRIRAGDLNQLALSPGEDYKFLVKASHPESYFFTTKLD